MPAMKKVLKEAVIDAAVEGAAFVVLTAYYDVCPVPLRFRTREELVGQNT